MKKNDLRIVFMGTPDFAVASLDALIKNGYNIVGVITSPDKPAGRGQQLQESAVKKYSVEHQLNILQPDNLKDEKFISQLKSLNANLQIVVAFRMLPEIVWNMPALGTFNLHASLLPQYRGAAPINRAIMNGEKTTGVTTFFLQHEIDTGNILFSESVTIGENETAGELHDKLMSIGAALVVKTVRAIEEDNYTTTKQVNIKSDNLKSAPKIFKPDCKINWNLDTYTIHNFIRGLSPYPAAWTELIGPDNSKQILKIFKAKPEINEHTLHTGTIESNKSNSLKIACSNGFIHLEEIQLAGKKRMKADEFLRGFALDKSWKAL